LQYRSWAASQRKNMRPRDIPIEIRFWTNVNKNGPVPRHSPNLGACWLWTGRRHGSGCRYGAIGFNGVKNVSVHRLAFFLEYGRWPVPQALHRCDVCLCVRPSHLFEGTPRDNAQDREQKGRGNVSAAIAASAIQQRAKRACMHGHPYTVANIYWVVTRSGNLYRQCRICQAERAAKYRRSSRGT
jgi:hypothetical protein